MAVEFAEQCRVDDADGGGGAGARGDERESGGAGATKIFIGPVDDVLRVGRVVNRGDRAALSAEARA